MNMRCSLLHPMVCLALVSACSGDSGADEIGAETGATDSGTENPDSGTENPDSGTDGPDSGTDDSSSDDTDTGETGETGEEGLVSVFVAQGKVGRTTLSCDDGHSWIHDRSQDLEGSAEACDTVQSVACFEGPCSFWHADNQECVMQESCDCDHHPGNGTGLAFGKGVFVGAWGWGPKGALEVSSDGQEWTIGYGPTTQAGVAFGNGTFIAGEREPRLSTDGLTWVDGGPADFRNENDEVIYNARTLGFADVAGGQFVAGASSGNGSDLMLSADEGQSWYRPTNSWECGGGFRSVAGGNGVIVVLFGDKTCRSADEGASFELTPMPGGTGLVFDGEQFVAWTSDARWTSSDGASWESESLTIEGLPDGHSFSLGPIARSEETGTLVSVRGAWKSWYDDQDFYRSDDGLTWEALEPGSFAPSHPITHIAAGRLPASACE